MPLMSWVCVACKASKTKCVNFAPGQRCDRCARIGLRCEPAPQRAQRMSHKSLGPALKVLLDSSEAHHATAAAATTTMVLPLVQPDAAGPSGALVEPAVSAHAAHIQILAAEPATAPPPSPSSTSTACVPVGNPNQNVLPSNGLLSDYFRGPSISLGGEQSISEAILGSGMPQEAMAGVLRMLLKNWAAIARRRNGYQLMAYTVFLSRKFDIPMDEVMPVATRPELQNCTAFIPLGEPVAKIVASSHALVVARCVCEGSVHFAANCPFEHRVCSTAELRDCWRANEKEVASLFLHEDDMEALHVIIARLWQVGVSGKCTSTRSDRPVRVLDRVVGRYIFCDAVGTLLLEHEAKKESWAMELFPREALDISSGAAALGWRLPLDEPRAGGVVDDSALVMQSALQPLAVADGNALDNLPFDAEDIERLLASTDQEYGAG